MKKRKLFIYGCWIGVKLAMKAVYKVMLGFFVTVGVLSCLTALGSTEEEEES